MVQTKQYLDIVDYVLNNGEEKRDRTGVGTLSVFDAPQMVFDLQKSFPLVTAKRTAFKSMANELFWMISGSTNNNDLLKTNTTIWNEWAKPDGDLGPIYGKQWRKASRFVQVEKPIIKSGNPFSLGSTTSFEEIHVDQLADAIKLLKTDPDSRRIIVDAWQIQDLNKMSLTPCHMMFQLYRRGEFLDLKMYQRSADLFLGVPFNIASYALLNHLIAHVADLKPGRLIHLLGDAHIYKNHIDQCREMLNRPLLDEPTLTLSKDCPKDIDSINLSHIVLTGYNPHPTIKAEVAI